MKLQKKPPAKPDAMEAFATVVQPSGGDSRSGVVVKLLRLPRGMSRTMPGAVGLGAIAGACETGSSSFDATHSAGNGSTPLMHFSSHVLNF